MFVQGSQLQPYSAEYVCPGDQVYMLIQGLWYYACPGSSLSKCLSRDWYELWPGVAKKFIINRGVHTYFNWDSPI